MSTELRPLKVNGRDIEVDREGNVYLAARSYFFTRLGKVIARHCQQRRLKALKWDGTLKVKIGGKSYHLHRLIAKAWLPNPEEKPLIFHRDGNKYNNHLSNLEWVDHNELRERIQNM